MNWTHPLRLDSVGTERQLTLSPTAAQRDAIARTLDLAELASLSADLTVAPQGPGWRLSGRVRADVVQTCGITLEPLPAVIDSRFQVDMIRDREAGQPAAALDLDPQQPDDPDIITDESVDLAAYVIEQLSLALDPFPRKPGAEFAPPETPPEPSPFSVLQRLKPSQPD